MFDLYPNKIHKKRKIRNSNRKEIEPHEVFLDSFTQKKIEKDNLPERKLEIPLSRKCFYGLLFFTIAVFFGLFARSFQLQIVKGNDFQERAERNKFAYSFIHSSRGVIYDKNLNQLVFNQPIFSLVAISGEIKESEIYDVFEKIPESIEFNQSKAIEEIKNSESEKITIVNDLKHEDLIDLEIITRNLPEFEIEKETVRHYQDSEIFSHVIGYLGRISPEEVKLFDQRYLSNNYIGKSGLEKSYEESLRVDPGQMKLERDVFGKLKSEELISSPQSGKNLILSIDSDLQKEIYLNLEKKLNEIGSQKASVIATNPQTGEVLSLVSYPGFDSNAFSLRDKEKIYDVFNDPRQPLLNRVISGGYSVGSTIKPLIAIAALEEKIVSPDKQFYSSGQITIPNPWNPSNPSVFRDNQAHGWVDLRRSIAVSSNVYFYIVGGGYKDQDGLGPNLIKKYLNMFGWGSKTNIDLPEEKTGFIPDPEWKSEVRNDFWRVGDTYNISIGQGDISVTPLQVSYAFNAVANNGKLMKPMIVKEIIDDQRNIIEIKEPEAVKSNFISDSSIKEVRKGMRDTVLYGSASMLNSLPVQAAAKTGTTQISKKNHYHNWVTVFAPYDDPEIVLTIILEEVQGIRAAAVPLAGDILHWYFSEKNQE